MKPTLTKISIVVISAIVICGLILCTSCTGIDRTPSRVEIAERFFDPALQDSAMIHGYILSLFTDDPFYLRSTIRIVQTSSVVIDNDQGYFSIKLPPGTYTIENFLSPTSGHRALRLENLKISASEKVKIIFFRGNPGY